MKFNVIIGILALILCYLISINFSSKYEMRRKFYEELYHFNNKLKIEVAYSKRTILSIISEEKGIIAPLLLDYFNNNKTLNNNECRFLKERDVVFFNNYLEIMGKHDATTELNQVEIFHLEIEGILTTCREEEKKYKPLCVKIGISFGLILFVLLL
jgi:hypothetical protein